VKKFTELLNESFMFGLFGIPCILIPLLFIYMPPTNGDNINKMLYLLHFNSFYSLLIIFLVIYFILEIFLLKELDEESTYKEFIKNNFKLMFFILLVVPVTWLFILIIFSLLYILSNIMIYLIYILIGLCIFLVIKYILFKIFARRRK